MKYLAWAYAAALAAYVVASVCHLGWRKAGRRWLEVLALFLTIMGLLQLLLWLAGRAIEVSGGLGLS